MDPTSTVTAPATEYLHNITSNVNCDTENEIYGIFCDKPDCDEVYIGKCSRRFGVRLNEHRSAVKRKQLSQEVANHFNQPSHGIHHLRAVVLEKVRNKDPFVLKAREHLYIGPKKFDAFNQGMNKEPWHLLSLASVGFFLKTFPANTGYFEPPFKLVQKNYLNNVELL